VEVAFIREKVMSLLPRYFVEIGGQVVCQVVKEITFIKPKYRLEGLSWRMEGDFWEHEYVMFDNNRRIMQLSKKWFTWGDSYEMDIVDPQDELLCLCVALAADCAVAAAAAAAST
jgi:uncharacterized protein YxjI